MCRQAAGQPGGAAAAGVARGRGPRLGAVCSRHGAGRLEQQRRRSSGAATVIVHLLQLLTYLVDDISAPCCAGCTTVNEHLHRQ